jgi:hypothetical protein
MRRACGWVLALSIALSITALVSAQVPGPYPGGPAGPGTPPPMIGPDGQPLVNDQGFPAQYGEPGPRYYEGSPMGEDPQGWYCDPQEMQSMGEATHPWIDSWYVRAEYLNWTVSDPGDVLLGAPVAGIADPRKPFLVTDTAGNPRGVATIPTTENMSLRDLNGARLYIGADLTYGGYMEVGGFFLERGRSFTSPTGLGQDVLYSRTPVVPATTPPTFVDLFAPRVIGTSTMVNGQLANNVELYNQDYNATYLSQMWGSDINYYFDTDEDGFIQFQPLIGFRHMSLREKLLQRGTFRDTTFNPAIDTNTEIDSYTRNNLYGVQGGFRAEAVTKYLVFGVDTKIALAANDQFAKVRVNNFRSNFDPEVVTDDREAHLSPIIDIGVYGKWNITPQFSLRGGYNFMWIGRVTRPEDNIYYNDRGAFVPPFANTVSDVIVNMKRSDVRVNGFSIGGEYRF